MEIEAFYLAQAALDYTMIRPDKIVFGGGVPHREMLFHSFVKVLNK